MNTGPITMRYRRATWIACATSGLVTALLWCIPLVLGQRYYGLDLTLVDLGTLCAGQQLVDSGQSLWLSPHLGNGMPYALRPTAQLFYPLRWIALALPPDLGTSLLPVMHLTIAASCTTWLARSFAMRPLTASCVGLAVAFSGTFVNLHLHSAIFLVGAAWLPLVWAATRRGLHPRGGAGQVLVVGLGLAAILLGGEAQSFGVGCALIVLEVLRSLRRCRRWRQGVALIATLPAALAASAVLWLGFFAEAALSRRASSLEPAEALTWSFGSSLWPAAMWPGELFSRALPHASLWQLVHAGDYVGTQWNLTPYVGTIFIVAWLGGCTDRRAWTATVTAAIGLVFALGDTLPVLPTLLELVPPLAMFRYPQKYLLITVLAAAIVAGLFLERQGRNPRIRRRLILASSTMVLGQVALLLAVETWPRSLIDASAWLFEDPLYRHLSPLPDQLGTALLHGLLPLGLLLGLIALAPRLARYGVLLLAADLMVTGYGTVNAGPPLGDLRSPLSALFPPDSPRSAVLCIDRSAGLGTFERAGVEPSWSQLAYWRFYYTAELQACDGMNQADPYSPLQTRVNERLTGAFHGHRSAPARALGCNILISRRAPEEGGVAPVPLNHLPATTRTLLERGPQLFHILDPIPRAFVADRPELVDSEETLLQAVRATRSSAAVVRLLDDPLDRWPANQPLPSGERAGELRLEWPSRDRATVWVTGSGGAVVGLRTSFQVGWHATQGQRELPLLRASGQHPAAVVDDLASGPIHFRYRPPRFGLSLLLSLCGLLGIALLAWWSGRRSPPPEPSATS